MTGPEHYREAERLIAQVEDPDSQLTAAQVQAWISLAQTHAALAQVAATFDAATEFAAHKDGADGWYSATGSAEVAR